MGLTILSGGRQQVIGGLDWLRFARGGGNPLASVPWVAQWKFNNNGNDSIGSNNLTNNGVATFTTGKLGGATGATQLTAASLQYFSIADNAALSMGNVDCTLFAWVYLDTKMARRIIYSKYNSTNANKEFILEYDNVSDRFSFTWWVNGTGTYVQVLANTFGSPSLATWYMIAGLHDATANTVSIQVNNGAADSLSATGGNDGAAPFQAGGLSAASLYMDGRLDNACFAKSAAGGGGVLTAAQRTAFYNSGNGTETLT